MPLKFRDSQGAFDLAFASALATDDTSAPTRVAHTLRGTAGNIGALTLSRAAAALEEACHRGLRGDALSDALAKVRSELEVVIHGLANLASTTVLTPSPHPVDLSPAQLKPHVDGLRQRLASSDPAALDLVEKLEALLTGRPEQRQAVQQISAKVNDFEFDEALRLLDAWADSGQR